MNTQAVTFAKEIAAYNEKVVATNEYLTALKNYYGVLDPEFVEALLKENDITKKFLEANIMKAYEAGEFTISGFGY